MTYIEICERLKAAGIENAEFEAMLLVNFFCKITRSEVLAYPERKYADRELIDAIEKRCGRYPLQYIFGEWDFYGETYKVNENCLIPRPETEMLVEYAVKNLPHGAYFADLCTGSGCIAVSTLVHRPDTNAVGVELFAKTSELAIENAERNGVSERFDVIRADVLKENIFENDEFDAIISNPPYIRTAVIDTLEEELFSEPRAALDGGEDGLAFYKNIISKYSNSLKKDGFILFEIGFDQKDEIVALAFAHDMLCDVSNDMSGNPRMAVLHRKNDDF